MTVYTDLLEWAEGRPWWQQSALVRLAAGHSFSPKDYADLADEILGGEPKKPDDGWLTGMQQPTNAAAPAVRLSSVSGISNVNRLAKDQKLTFEPEGLTVIFGQNGSGKSGYARLIKHLVRTRHHESILPDIFVDDEGPQSAELKYLVGERACSAPLDADAPIELSLVSYYDERCGDAYITTEGAAAYRPSVLRLLDQLVTVCDGVRAEIDSRLAENAERRASLPSVAPETKAGMLLNQLSGETDDETLDAMSLVPEFAEKELQQLREEQARLKATDPTNEVERISKHAKTCSLIASHLTGLQRSIGSQVAEDMVAARQRAEQTRQAAETASASQFDGEPLAGVGAQEWEALWHAAERYSTVVAYPDEMYPVTADGSKCVLCQQHLDQSARQRLDRFRRFVADDTQDQARAAAQEMQHHLNIIKGLEVAPSAVAVGLEVLSQHDPECEVAVRHELAAWAKRKEYLVLPESPTAPPEPDGHLRAELNNQSLRLTQEADAIDAATFNQRIKALAQEEAELFAAMTLAPAADALRAERDRRQVKQALDEARRQTDTRGISRASGDLTARHVTLLVQDRFSRESQDLRVDSVTLLGKGVKHGAVLHKPGFVGAIVEADLPQVLSEGEQTALGLAGYFVEAHLDESKSALILDDPVTSLDHLRRDAVADRLARFGKDRQVIVFTHDVSFAASLKKLARKHAVPFAERSVERRLADDLPGVTGEKHPWTIKDASQRIGDLRADLQRIRRSVENNEWDHDTYEAAVSEWAGRLSQTWERIISQEIADYVFDRSTLHVSVNMMKIVERIDAEDNSQLQESYNRCSGWTRHDQDMALNYSPPALDDLDAELALIDAWYKRVKKYRTGK